jgi:hypothetical protein
MVSGIDEVRIGSCSCCYEYAEKARQFWCIRSEGRRDIGFFNPDAYRKSHGDRMDVVNPQTQVGWNRENIRHNPEKYIAAISHFRCNSCGKRENKGEKEFNLMIKKIERFITGDVFPYL